jgi:hypothetical protein
MTCSDRDRGDDPDGQISRRRAAAPRTRPRALSGPLAGASFVASLVALNALSDVRYPMPGADPPAIRRYFSQEHRAARLGAVAQLIYAGCLAGSAGRWLRLPGGRDPARAAWGRRRWPVGRWRRRRWRPPR